MTETKCNVASLIALSIGINALTLSRESFLKQLKKARVAARIKQDYAAQVLNLNASSISAIEKGTRKLDVFEFLMLAHLYERPMSWFFRDYHEEWPLDQSLLLETLDPMLKESLKRLAKLSLTQQRQLTFQILTWLDKSS